MNNSDQDTDVPINFYEWYAENTDQQIKEILKNHKNYQEQAVAAAVKIAIERGLIHTEQDLMAPEYQVAAPEGWTAFPDISNVYHRKKLIASIFRVLFIASLIPIIFGAMKYAEGQLNMIYLGLGFGFAWLILSLLLLRTKKLILLFLLVILLIIVFFILGKRLFSQQFILVTDVLMLVIGTSVLLYLLLYLKKLIQANE